MHVYACLHAKSLRVSRYKGASPTSTNRPRPIVTRGCPASTRVDVPHLHACMGIQYTSTYFVTLNLPLCGESVHRLYRPALNTIYDQSGNIVTLGRITALSPVCLKVVWYII